MGFDLDAWIEKLKRCEYLKEDELKSLCEYVRPSPCCGLHHYSTMVVYHALKHGKAVRTMYLPKDVASLRR